MAHTATQPALRAREQALLDDVRRHATRLLPPGVVPSRFVLLEDFPRLPNGKTDRSRLPAPESATVARSAGGATHESPSTELQRRVADIWMDVLGLPSADVDVHTAFDDLGGSSLSMMQMAARVKAAVGQSVDLRRFMAEPTVAALSAALDGTVGSLPPRRLHYADEHTMRADAVLPDDVRPTHQRELGGPVRRVLLTGGTGYTGAYVLRELLRRDGLEVTVLARGEDGATVAGRALANMSGYGLQPDQQQRARVDGVVGDTSRPYLGMSRVDYERVARDCDVIIHNAADSRWTTSYEEAKVTNVLGSVEVLRLARHGGNTPVHYVGSTGSLPTRAGSPTWHEEAVDELDGVLGGYRQTKWVSDSLMHEARRRGMHVTVYRPGALVGDQETGACSTDTFINHLLRGWVGMGVAMRYDLQVELVPIDYCARVVAHLALSGGDPATYHVLGTAPVMMDDFLEHLIGYGYPLDVVDYPRWYEQLLTLAEAGEENDLVPYLPLFSPEAPGLEIGLAGNRPHFDHTRLDAALEGSGIEQRPFDADVMTTYLDYFVATGFLPAPPTSPSPTAVLESETAP